MNCYDCGLRGHADAHRCCGNSLRGSALVRVGVRQHARPESISKRAPSTTRTSPRSNGINNLRAVDQRFSHRASRIRGRTSNTRRAADRLARRRGVNEEPEVQGARSSGLVPRGDRERALESSRRTGSVTTASGCGPHRSRTATACAACSHASVKDRDSKCKLMLSAAAGDRSRERAFSVCLDPANFIPWSHDPRGVPARQWADDAARSASPARMRTRVERRRGRRDACRRSAGLPGDRRW